MDIVGNILPKASSKKKALIVLGFFGGITIIGITLCVVNRIKEKRLISGGTNAAQRDGTISGSGSVYKNDGSYFKFTNKPLVYGTLVGMDIQDATTNKKVGTVTSNNQLLGTAHSVEHGFVVYTDRNANRKKIIYKAANVVNGQ
jgi:hypothetical protein